MRRSPSRAVASRPSRRRSGCKTRVASIERGPLFGAGRCAFGMAIIGDLSGTFSDAKTSSLVAFPCALFRTCLPLRSFLTCRFVHVVPRALLFLLGVCALHHCCRRSKTLFACSRPLPLLSRSSRVADLPAGARGAPPPSLSPLSFTTPSQGRVQRGRASRAFARMGKLTQKEGAHAVW